MDRSLLFAFSTVLLLSLVPMGATAEDAILKEGSPLDLYLRKSGTPLNPSLKLYPSFYPESENSSGYVIPLGSRGSGEDTVEMYMPRDSMDNSLKYKPNGTLDGHYSFHISAGVPKNPQYSRYKVRVLVEMDYERRDRFDTDKEFSFNVEGDADGQVHRNSGDYDLDLSEYQRFHPENGGRIKVSLIREDFGNTTLKFYVGFLNKTSNFRIPYSRYPGGPVEDDDDFRISWPIIVITIVVVIGVSYLIYKSTKQEKGREEDKGASGNGRKRHR